MIEAQDSKKQEGGEQVAALQAQVSALKSEKSQVEVDLNKTEIAFSDLHRKYEKLKEVLGLGRGCVGSCPHSSQRTIARMKPS